MPRTYLEAITDGLDNTIVEAANFTDIDDLDMPIVMSDEDYAEFVDAFTEEDMCHG